MKKTFALLLAITLLLTCVLVSCKSDEKAPDPTKTEAATPTEGEKTLYIPMISMGFQHQYWQAVYEGAKQAAAEFGVEITYEAPELETQIDKQLEMIDAALAKNPDAICIAPLDGQAVIPMLEKARDAGVPVICFDAGAESDIPVGVAATNNYGAASAAADELAKLLNEEGEVAVIGYSQTSTDGVARVAGFTETIEKDYPNMTVVDIQYGDGDPLKSTEITKSLLLAHPDLKGIYAANEGSAIGMINGTKEANMVGKVVLAGFDSGALQIQAVRDGTCAGAITQNPVGIGYEAVKAAVKAIKGESVPAEIDTGFYWYTAENIDDPEIAAALYD